MPEEKPQARPHLALAHGAALQRRPGAAEQGRAGALLLAQDGAVDQVEAISREQPDPAGGAAEALGREDAEQGATHAHARTHARGYLQVVDVPLGPHHHLAGRDGLAAAAARAAVSKQPAHAQDEGTRPGTEGVPVPNSPDVVAPAEDQASFAVAAGADVAQPGLAAGAAQAAAVPVALHGEEQEAVPDPPPTAGTGAGGRRQAGRPAVHHGLLHTRSG